MKDIDDFYAEMRVFSVFVPDGRNLIFTRFVDIGGLSCRKTCENGAEGDVLCVRPCSVNASVASCAPF